MKRKMDEEEDVTIATQQQPPGIAPGGDSFPRLQNRALAPAPVCEPMPENIHPSAGIQRYSSPTTYQVPPIGQGTLGKSPSGHDTHLYGSQLSSPHPRSLTHPNSAHSQAQAQGGWQQVQFLDINDALSYLLQVKERFGNQSRVYRDFLEIIKEHKAQIIDTRDVIDRVSNLFKGHPDLIRVFMPPDPKIEVQTNHLISVTIPRQAAEPMEHAALKMQNCYDDMHRKQLLPTQPSAMPSKSLPRSPHPYGQPPSLPGFPTQHPVPADTGHTSHTTQHPGQLQLLNVQTAMFNKAVNFVKKIKKRFQNQPEMLKTFMGILWTSEQCRMKASQEENPRKPPQPQFFAEIAQLLKNHEDLLAELDTLVPDPNGSHLMGKTCEKLDSVHIDHGDTVNQPLRGSSTNSCRHSNSKRLIQKEGPIPCTSGPGSTPPMKKKLKPGGFKDSSGADTRKHGNLGDLAFLEKVRKALKSRESYENFLHCLALFNQETVSRGELLHLVCPFLSDFPELFSWFKASVGDTDVSPREALPKDLSSDGITMEIDFASCKRLGPSYRTLPKSFQQPKCSGRTALCHEVLNDTFVSWTENLKFVSSNKTQYEEQMYRCEDERFELDYVLETNLATIRVLEGIEKKMSHMSEEDKSHFHLDSCLGGSSEVVHLKAVQRLYGGKASDIIDGLKRNPVVVVPIVLKRLKSKDKEWRKAQCAFNQVWHEQNEKYHLKSLDHQDIDFKKTDTEALCSKNLLNEIETIFNEQQEQVADGNPPPPVEAHHGIAWH